MKRMSDCQQNVHSPAAKGATSDPRARSSSAATRLSRWALVVALGLGAGASTGCKGAPDAVYTRRQEADRLVADLRVTFLRAAGGSDRAVMANTDEASVAFAREAERDRQAARRDADALAPLLRGLGYTREGTLLAEFVGHFAEYEALDREVLALAVENTNLKAQRLSFGPVREAADAFRSAVDAIAGSAPPPSACRAASLAASAALAVRDIQVLHAPHIAEADDGAMSRLEAEMASREASARASLRSIEELLDPAARAQAAPAVAALDRFAALHEQLVTLSRRNSNVRSLALSLGRKRTLTAACQSSLDGLAAALANEGSRATR